MESIITLRRTCPNCGKRIIGRRGRKYCSDHCRIDSHNQERAKSYNPPFVRNITNALLKNRRILESLLGDQTTVKATKDNLIQKGFNFKYLTNTHTQGERIYSYCYDYGYLPLKDEWYLIVKLNK